MAPALSNITDVINSVGTVLESTQAIWTYIALICSAMAWTGRSAFKSITRKARERIKEDTRKELSREVLEAQLAKRLVDEQRAQIIKEIEVLTERRLEDLRKRVAELEELVRNSNIISRQHEARIAAQEDEIESLRDTIAVQNRQIAIQARRIRALEQELRANNIPVPVEPVVALTLGSVPDMKEV